MSLRTFVSLVSIISLSIMLLLSSASAAPYYYTPGVKVGDNGKYNTHLTISGNKTLLGSFAEQGFGAFNQSIYATLNITRVSGTVVNFTTVFHYLNGTTHSMKDAADVSQHTTSQGISPPSIIAKGLAKTDPVQQSPNSPTLNDTKTLTVLGSSRIVDYLNFTMTQNYDYSYYNYNGPSGSLRQNWGYAWDQATGMPLSVTFTYILTRNLSSGTTSGTISWTIAMSDTNLWTTSQSSSNNSSNQPENTILGLQSNLFYVIVGAVAVVVAGVVGFAVMKSRQPKITPQPTDTPALGPTDTPPSPSQGSQ